MNIKSLTPIGYRWTRRGRLVEHLTSADTAIVRLRYVVALDRAKIDGRNRVAELYSGPGERIMFDQPLSLLPGEEVVVDYEITADGIRGFATIQLAIEVEDL